VTVNNAYGVTPSNPVTITVGAGGAATAIAAGYECYWNIKSGGGTSSFGAVTAAGAVGIGTTTFPGNGGNGGSGGGGYGGPVYGYASGSNTGGTAGGAGVSQGGSGGTGQGSFPSFSAFTINTVTAGAGGAGGITTDWGSGGGGGGVVVTGSNYPHGSTAGGEAWTGNWVAGGSDGVGFGGGGAGGWGGDSLPPGKACYAGDAGAAGVVYIEW
jgi:hypothetical protein